MEIKGNEVKLSRKELRTMGWQKSSKLFIEDIPRRQEYDVRLFEKLVDKIDPTEPIIGTMEGAELARIENRAKIFGRAIDMFVEQQMATAETDLQQLLENQEINL